MVGKDGINGSDTAVNGKIVKYVRQCVKMGTFKKEKKTVMAFRSRVFRE